ncbi:ABC transporter permease [Microbacterium oleivorans]|uniref:ABC transporter permease n=1 Tax=Microbacterium oleivorans TaxID=273677 RepID=A0A4R5YFS2_9MICO|nr:ABC transporter permease [Microbacterium oleivorans]TDL44011.1 ABC transporter permease [Microbacterium oleivorans]
MARFILSRAVRTALTVFAVLSLAFVLARLTGDPVRLMLPQEATQADVDAMRATLGLDLPLWEQYLSFLAHAAQGDLGDSIRQGVSAVTLVLERLPATLELAFASFAIGLLLAVVIAVLGELSRNETVRATMLWIATTRQAIPPYLFGILLILVFSVWLGALPAIGRTSYASYILPIATIASFEVALYLRLLNQAFAESRHQDFVRTALAKGASRGRIVLRHQLPNALLPLVTVAGINLGVLVGGLVVIETVFNWPGLGRLIVQGVEQRDYPIVQAGVVIIAIVFVVINLIVDMLYAAMDPRVRLAR